MNSSMYAWWRCTNRMSPIRTDRSSITSLVSFHQAVIMAVHPLERYAFAIAVQSALLAGTSVSVTLNGLWTSYGYFAVDCQKNCIPKCNFKKACLCHGVRYAYTYVCECASSVHFQNRSDRSPCRGLDMIHILDTHYSLEITVRTEQ